MSTPAITSQMKRLLRQVRAARNNLVLHYDHSKDDLAVWHWPTNERGERIVPSDLDSHRLSHRFRGPCCLCPIDPVHNNTFIEAAIYAAPTGRYVGEYVAQCAERECGYLVNLEHVYSKPGVPLRYYARRDYLVENEIERGPPQEIDMGEIEQWAPPAERLQSIFEELLRLDSVLNPGLRVREFKRLFAICRECRLVMTKRVVPVHVCIPGDVPENDIIDLTSED